MTKKIYSLFCLLFLCSSAYAQDIYFFNGTTRACKIIITLPNGARQEHAVSDSNDSLSHDYFNLVPGIKQVQVQVVDDQGTPLCSGVAQRKGAYTIFPDGQGAKMLPTGYYGGKTTQAALFMNSTGENLTLDLVGNNGVGSVRGIVPPVSFDPKSPVKLDPREASYSFKVTSGGSPVAFYNDNAHVVAGKYYWIRKDGRGNYRLEELCHLQP